MRQLGGDLDGEKKKASEWKQKYKTQCISFKENYEAFKALHDEYETLTGQLSKIGLKIGLRDGEEDIIESLEAQLDELERKKSDDEKDHSLAQARKEVEQLQAKVKEMDAALESRVAKFASTATTVASLRQDSPDRMRERVETLSISNDILREERISLEKELHAAKAVCNLSSSSVICNLCLTYSSLSFRKCRKYLNNNEHWMQHPSSVPNQRRHLPLVSL
jgi:hypothetical protein